MYYDTVANSESGAARRGGGLGLLIRLSRFSGAELTKQLLLVAPS